MIRPRIPSSPLTAPARVPLHGADASDARRSPSPEIRQHVSPLAMERSPLRSRRERRRSRSRRNMRKCADRRGAGPRPLALLPGSSLASATGAYISVFRGSG